MANHTISSLPFLYGTTLGSGKCQRIKKNAFRKAPILRSFPLPLPSQRDTLFSSYVMATEGPPRAWGPSHAYGASQRMLISRLKGRKTTWTVPPIYQFLAGCTQKGKTRSCPALAAKKSLMLFLLHSSASTIPSLCLPPLPHTNKCTVGEFSHSASSQRAFFWQMTVVMEVLWTMAKRKIRTFQIHLPPLGL